MLIFSFFLVLVLPFITGGNGAALAPTSDRIPHPSCVLQLEVLRLCPIDARFGKVVTLLVCRYVALVAIASSATSQARSGFHVHSPARWLRHSKRCLVALRPIRSRKWRVTILPVDGLHFGRSPPKIHLRRFQLRYKVIILRAIDKAIQERPAWTNITEQLVLNRLKYVF